MMTYTTFPGTTNTNGIPQNTIPGSTNQTFPTTPGTGYTNGQPFGQTVPGTQFPTGQYTNGQYTNGQFINNQYVPFGYGLPFHGQFNNQYVPFGYGLPFHGQFNNQFHGFSTSPFGAQYVPFFSTPFGSQNYIPTFGQYPGQNFGQYFGQFHGATPFGYNWNTTNSYGFPSQTWNSFNGQFPQFTSFNQTTPSWFYGRSFNGFTTPSTYSWNTPFNYGWNTPTNYIWNTPFNYNWNTPFNYGWNTTPSFGSQIPFQTNSFTGGVNGWNYATPFNTTPWSYPTLDYTGSPFWTNGFNGIPFGFTNYGITPGYVNSFTGTQIPFQGVPSYGFTNIPVTNAGPTGSFVPTTGECCGIRQAA